MEMLQDLRDLKSTLTSEEGKHMFVEAARFADYIKYVSGGSWQSPYHYIDIPYITEGTAADYKIAPATKDLTMGIENIIDWLSGKNGDAYLNSYMYTYLNNKLYPGKPHLAKSYALRLLIHFMGDQAQPLHNIERFSSKYPNGDGGGNAFPLLSKYSVTELHSLFDTVLYVERTNIGRVSPRSFLSSQIVADH
jgi:hypothetical protein